MDFPKSEKATLNGTILCYAAARADLGLKRTPLFDQAFECAKKSLTAEQFTEMLKIPCDFAISNSGDSISYHETFVHRKFSILTTRQNCLKVECAGSITRLQISLEIICSR